MNTNPPAAETELPGPIPGGGGDSPAISIELAERRFRRQLEATKLVPSRRPTWPAEPPASGGMGGASRQPRYVPRGAFCIAELQRTRMKALRDGRIDHALRDRGAPIPEKVAWDLDLPLVARAGSRGGTLRAVFSALRSRGVEPHPFGKRRDGEVITWLGTVLTDPTPGPTDPVNDRFDKTANAPDPRFGINKPHFVDPSDEDAEAWGNWCDQMLDIASATLGTVRQFEPYDLDWRSVFQQEAVPPPREIWNRMTADGCAMVMERFGQVFLYCLVTGLQVVPTLFTMGGGNNPLDWLEARDPALFQLMKGINKDALLLNYSGWDPWYVTHWESGILSDDEVRYQANVFSVSWEVATSAYGEECARRKALAVAAFGLALGEYFGLLSDALASIGRTVTEWIPYLECGNELSGSFKDVEYGRFMAILAGTILSGAPELRFRVAEVASEKDWQTNLDWIRNVLLTGLPAETDRWKAVMAYPTGGAGASEAAWLETCVSASVFWPPWLGGEVVIADPCVGTSAVVARVMTDPTSLVHQVGFHFYHRDILEDPSEEEYQGEATLVEVVGTLESLLRSVWFSSAFRFGRGYSLTWSASEVGFNAVNNSRDSATQYRPHNPDASLRFQAGILVRRLVTLFALGAERVGWHSYMSTIARGDEANLDTYFAHGIRNDQQTRSTFSQAVDAWRRPAWLAYQRLVWLLSAVDGSREFLLSNLKGGVFLLRLESSAGFPSTTRLSLRYRYAYIGWVEQEADWISSYDVSLDDVGTGYEVLPLVPIVAPCPSDPPPVDENGFAAGESVDWQSSGGEVRTGPTPVGSPPALILHLTRLHGGTEPENPAPLCVLTDATWPAVVSDEGDSDLVPDDGRPQDPVLSSGRLDQGPGDLRSRLDRLRAIVGQGSSFEAGTRDRVLAELDALALHISEFERSQTAIGRDT